MMERLRNSFWIQKTKSNANLYDFDDTSYESEVSKFKRKKRDIVLEEYSKGILEVFVKEYPMQWIEEGIKKEVMDKYNILFSISQNKIIIPHYDIDNRLIGIRGRSLNEDEIEAGCKYMPVKIENKWYSHSLSLNLYGINLNKEGIKNTKQVILFEGELSPLSVFPVITGVTFVANEEALIGKAKGNLVGSA